jgi:uncharacterized Zn finger protein
MLVRVPGYIPEQLYPHVGFLKEKSHEHEAAAHSDENKSKQAQNEGWATLSWDDLTEWAGSRSVSRGRAYQSQGRVGDLAISEDGWLR